MDTTSSDEKHRLQKAIDGSTGLNALEALDEAIDNAQDANATTVTLTFKDREIKKIHNNGKPMSAEDRVYSLKLDGTNKKTDKKQKGCKGIGSFYSMGLLCGQCGKHIITSVQDDDETMQVVIDNERLLHDTAPDNTWTGEHEHRPRWKSIRNTEKKYSYGVTREYETKTKHKFILNTLMKHYAFKYDKIKIKIVWGDEEEYTPTKKDYISHEENENEYVAYDDGNTLICSISDNKYYKVTGNDRCKLTTEIKNEHPMKPTENKSHIIIYVPKLIDVASTVENVKTRMKEKNLHVDSSELRTILCNVVMENLYKKDTKLDLSTDTDKRMKDVEQYYKDIPNLTVKKDGHIICYSKDTVKISHERSKADKKIMYTFNIVLSDDNLTTQENKNHVNITNRMKKLLNQLYIDTYNKVIKDMQDVYKITETEPAVNETSQLEPLVNETSPVELVVDETSPVELVVDEASQLEPLVNETSPVEMVVDKISQLDSVADETSPAEPVVDEMAQLEPVVDEMSQLVSVETSRPEPEPVLVGIPIQTDVKFKKYEGNDKWQKIPQELHKMAQYIDTNPDKFIGKSNNFWKFYQEFDKIRQSGD